jgi:hypothetical protein
VPSPDVERFAERASAAAYGNVLVLAALSTLGIADVAEGHGIELVAGVGIGTWVAHLFAEVLGNHVRHPRPLARRELARAAADGSPILGSTILPALALALGRTDVLSDSTARVIAMLVAVLQLVAVGALVARDPDRRANAWAFPLVTAIAGTAVVAITVRLGH